MVFDWQIFSPDGQTVRSSSGIDILARGPATDIVAPDYVFVMASYAHDGHDTLTNRALLRRIARLNAVTVGFDAGPWLLASAGLLDGRAATVHWDLLDAFSERFLNVEARRAHVVRDGAIMTCAGAISALEMTLDLIADHEGLAARLDVQAFFSQGDPPIGPSDRVADPLVREALSLMRDHVERPLLLVDLAKRLSCQPRTLDRHFRNRLGAPPGTVYRHLRLSAARKLLEDTQLSVSEISVRCGYDSPAALTRAIRRNYGATPRAIRQARIC